MPSAIPQVAPSSEEKLLAFICHVCAFFGMSVVTILVPIVLMMISDSPFVKDQAKEAINFQLSVFLWALIWLAGCLILVGFIMLPVLFIWAFFVPIFAMVTVAGGSAYRYKHIWRPIQ